MLKASLGTKQLLALINPLNPRKKPKFMNYSFISNSFVKSWKMSKIIPVLTSGNFEDLCNKWTIFYCLYYQRCPETSSSSLTTNRKPVTVINFMAEPFL